MGLVPVLVMVLVRDVIGHVKVHAWALVKTHVITYVEAHAMEPVKAHAAVLVVVVVAVVLINTNPHCILMKTKS
jgi:hypothetical protein